MIAILQFDAASRMHLETLLAQGQLPTLSGLRRIGTWYDLETPATHFEGAAEHSLYTGTGLAEHGLYYPWQWLAHEQRVRFYESFSTPETVWERIARAGRRALVIDAYEMSAPRAIDGIFLNGWQFKNRVVLRPCSVPGGLHARFARKYGKPPVGEEVYGRPVSRELRRLRETLRAAPRRGADLAAEILTREHFDLFWIGLSAAHIGGHRFFDLSRFSEEVKLGRHSELRTALADIYKAIDESMARILDVLPPGTDIMVLSPTGMGPDQSRSHLLPGMLEAVLADGAVHAHRRHAPAGSSLWRIRSLVPTAVRASIAKALPDRWAVDLAARLELRDVDWTRTKAFMVPNDDAGYVRLNLRGRERDGIVDPQDAGGLLQKITDGLKTFSDADGHPAVRDVVRVSQLGLDGPRAGQLPDLVIHWNQRVVSPLLGVASPAYGEVPSPGWGTGRTGRHTDDAWALVAPGSSTIRRPTKSPHVIDIAATICAALGVDTGGLPGQPLLEPDTA